MTIHCIFLLVLVCSSATCLAVHENADTLYGIGCKIKKPYTNSHITPVMEHPSEVTGCFSNNAASAEQEVHVLSLLNSGFDAVDTKNGYLPSVTVNVQPRSKERFTISSVIIILHSFTPVMWQVHLHSGNSTNFHVVVNKPSYVVPTVAATVSRRKFPSSKRLPIWIRSHYGAVTSYSLIHLANEITLFLGIDLPATSPDCNVNSKRQSANVKASFVQLQLAAGCTMSRSPVSKSNQMLYVIELDSKVSNSDTLIQLQQQRSPSSDWSSVVEQNVILILKSHVPLEWVIESRGIEGSLLIIAEHPVHVRTNILFVTAKIEKQILPSSTSVLLSKIKNSFGFADIYIKTSKSNRINIAVKGKAKHIDELLYSKNMSFMEFVNIPSTPVISIPNDKNMSHTDSYKSSVSPESWDHMIANLVSLTCSRDKISVSLPIEDTMKIFVSTLGPDSRLLSVTLADVGCKSQQNGTHFILQSKWSDCGTKAVTNGGLEYHNQIQFVTTKQELDNVSSNEQKRLPTDDDDYISEYGSGSDAVSLSLLRSEESVIYPLPFHCDKPFMNDDNQKSSGEKYELNLYTKKDYKQSIPSQSFPFDVVVHDHLFAEANIKADLRLCIIIDECWLAETDNKYKATGKRNTLIKQGCPTDLSVDILTKSHCSTASTDAEHYKMRFSFQLSEELMDRNLFLHCRLTSCAMQDSKELNTNQCISDEHFCLKQSLRPYLDTLFGKKYSLIVKGPFRVVPKQRGERRKDVLSVLNPESSSSPSENNFIVDYSFDKLTGNTKKNPVSQQLVFVGLSTEAVVGIAFASFIIGAGLMATLWLIHMYTEPSRRFKQSRKQSAKQSRTDGQLNSDRFECADNSVPCSAKPLSVQICA